MHIIWYVPFKKLIYRTDNSSRITCNHHPIRNRFSNNRTCSYHCTFAYSNSRHYLSMSADISPILNHNFSKCIKVRYFTSYNITPRAYEWQLHG